MAAAPSWAQQDTCQMLTQTCAPMGGYCSDSPFMMNHTYIGCQSPNVCAGRNMTCRAKPMVGTACQDDEDCQYGMQMQGDTMMCDKSGSNPVCALSMDTWTPTDAGCRANGDWCMVDTDCTWGTCMKNKCSGLQMDADCTAATNWMGCANDLFCWQNTTSMMNWCKKRIANNMAAPWSSWGWAYGCQSGFYRNNTMGVPTCVSYDNMWGTVGVGGMCYYDYLMENSHALCRDGLYCDTSTQMSGVCAMDGNPGMCNVSTGGVECTMGVMRPSNVGECGCNSTSGAAPMCVRTSSCGQSGANWAMMNKNTMMCGFTAVQGMGRCPGGGNINYYWNQSCSFRAQMCVPKSYQNCWANFEKSLWTKVLVPSGMLCGVNPMMAAFWPSYCNSASLTQPLLVLVAVLIALLQL